MIPFLLDVLYLILLLALSPWLVYKSIRTGKYRTGLAQKLAGVVPVRNSDRPCVWFHAVSVGEVLLLRRVVAEFNARRSDVDIVISTTTVTGMELAQKHFAAYHVIYFPLDLSGSVTRAIRRIRPDVVALAELELWPNFVLAAKRFGSRVVLINGRMSPRSHRGYRRIRFLMRYLLGKIDAIAAQTPEYRDHFIDVGAPSDRVVVTGSVKYDGVETRRGNAATVDLRSLFGLRSDEVIWVAGSTSEPEERMVIDAYQQLRKRHPNLRLILVPRHRERFDEVARLIQEEKLELVRRSQIVGNAPPAGKTPSASVPAFERQSPLSGARRAVILVDTLGELSAVWGLADIAFVGGSFAPRGGQNMIEPAGYGAAVVFGPGVWNFQDTVNHLLANRAAVQLASPEDLETAVDRLIQDAGERQRLGRAAQMFVERQSGATARTIGMLIDLVPNATQSASSARTAA